MDLAPTHDGEVVFHSQLTVNRVTVEIRDRVFDYGWVQEEEQDHYSGHDFTHRFVLGFFEELLELE